MRATRGNILGSSVPEATLVLSDFDDNLAFCTSAGVHVAGALIQPTMKNFLAAFASMKLPSTEK